VGVGWVFFPRFMGIVAVCSLDYYGGSVSCSFVFEELRRGEKDAFGL
jgi:hypothetical protein